MTYKCEEPIEKIAIRLKPSRGGGMKVNIPKNPKMLDTLTGTGLEFSGRARAGLGHRLSGLAIFGFEPVGPR